MRLERAELWHPHKSQAAFRHSPWGALFVCAFLCAGGLVWGSLAVGTSFGCFLWAISAPCFLIATLLFPAALRAFGSNNWILLKRESGLAIKVRSYWNADLPKRDLVVAWLPSEEVRAIRKVRAERDVPARGDSGTEREKLVFLDVLLSHTETDELAEACERERERRGKGRAHFHHYPVSVPAPGTIRILWTGVRPGIAKALRLLGERYEIEEEIALAHQDWRALEKDELENLILELAQSGENVRAVVLTRLRYGKTLTEAKHFVDELTGRQAA